MTIYTFINLIDKKTAKKINKDIKALQKKMASATTREIALVDLRNYFYSPLSAYYINISGGIEAIAKTLCNVGVYVRGRAVHTLNVAFDGFGNVQKFPLTYMDALIYLTNKKLLKIGCPNIPKTILAIDGACKGDGIVSCSSYVSSILDEMASRDPYLLKPYLDDIERYVDSHTANHINNQIENQEELKKKHNFVGHCSLCGRRIYDNMNYYVWGSTEDIFCDRCGPAIKSDLESFENRYNRKGVDKTLIMAAAYHHHHPPPLLRR